MRRVVIASLVFGSFVLPAQVIRAQAAAPVQDPQAVSWVSKALTALNAKNQLSDVTLAGSATRTLGSDDETGNITLKALGATQSRFDLALSSGTLSEIWNTANGYEQGFWVGADGNSHQMASANTFTSPVWFDPALSVLSQLSNSAVGVSYVDAETQNGSSVVRLRFGMPAIGPDATTNSLVAAFSSTDILLDSGSALPVALIFNVHPDKNSLINIPVEVVYSSYTTVNGFQIPFHIQRYLNGALFMDITIQSAKVNSGLSVSNFSS